MENVNNLKVGDRVILIPGYYAEGLANPLNVVGTIINLSNLEYEYHCWEVNWDNGRHNAYKVHELQLAYNFKFQIKELVFYNNNKYKINQHIPDKEKEFYTLKNLEKNEILYSINVEDLRLLTKEEIDSIIYYDELQEYRDNILEILDEEQFEIEGEINNFTLIVHYPHLKMINKNSKTHDLYDFFIKIIIKDYKLDTILGARTTFSKIEYGKYVHNYISDFSNEFSSFCLGNSSINNYFHDDSLTPDNIITFLEEFETYLCYGGESNPYRKFSQLSGNGSRLVVIRDGDADTLLNKVFSFIDVDRLSIVVSRDTHKIELNNYLYDLLNEHTHVKGFVGEDDRCYTDINQNIETRKIITFKGKEYYHKIIDETDEESKSIPPELVDRIIIKLNNLLNDKIKSFKQYTIVKRTKVRDFTKFQAN